MKHSTKPAMVAALEQQYTTEPGNGFTWHHWQLVGEGLLVELSVVEGYGHVAVDGFGVHARRRFRLVGEVTEPSCETAVCLAIGGAGWCVVDNSRGDRLVKQWAADRDDAPIWAALRELAGEVQW